MGVRFREHIPRAHIGKEVWARVGPPHVCKMADFANVWLLHAAYSSSSYMEEPHVCKFVHFTNEADQLLNEQAIESLE